MKLNFQRPAAALTDSPARDRDTPTTLGSRRSFLTQCGLRSLALGAAGLSLVPGSAPGWAGDQSAPGQITGQITGPSQSGPSRSNSSDAPVQLRSPDRPSRYRVRMEIDLKGNVRLTPDPLQVARGSRGDDERLLPVTGDVLLDYEERFLRPAGTDSDSAIVAVERHYHDASGTSRLNRNESAIRLRNDVRRTIARREFLPETIYSDTEYLSQGEIDLLRTPLSSTAIDELIPAEEMIPGQPQSVDALTVASVFNLSGVTKSDVNIELVQADPAQAKLQLRGKMDGSVNGVSTVLRVVGKLTLDRTTGAVTWAAVAIHETREIGKAEPGFDLTATVRMIRQASPKTTALAQTPPTIEFDQPAPLDRLLTTVTSDHAGASALVDRRWRIIQDQPGLAVLRMIDQEHVIAQCNLRPLARLDPGQQWTLAAFEQDCRRTLGKQLSEILQAEQQLSEAGTRVLRVTAAGQVEGVPIQWILMHFSDDDGRRVLATLTMDGASVARLDGSDVQFAETLCLSDPVRAGLAGPATAAPADLGAQAELGKKSERDGANQLKSSQSAAEDVLSASDVNPPRKVISARDTGPTQR